ncbi:MULTISPECIES: bacillithiol biosynthesis deacetylase BshB1 [unclassified Spirosoma]|uniref:bacillithiol biosynthesis deacetylase BshB1 n=1 Tax=unclassified Spirosoma TaxID=2621999 RepID=UPI000963D1CA|nr:MULTISPECIES: bacillithiol biosynthesis deacetylase BshB1 [unclassified Spirosoma]MBN8825373.1 bacillithiol biosynthesis deacetylase BshB1 [Spirosoma sp.]OJW77460.1 MAG: bacillithiol biosynthesis deacetylase BshB1 [Spirosoma sp. 48-14]
MTVDVLAIAAHPDDVEMTCAGTVLSLIAQGKTVAVVDLTRGELGTRGTPEIRAQEAAEGARIMQLSARENMGFRDGFFRNDEEHQLALIPLIRQYRPQLILTNTPDDRHPDHGRASELVADACFYSGLRQIKTIGKDGQPQEAHRPVLVYNFIQDRSLKPDFVVDITPYWDQKLAAIQAYKSQFFNPDSDEPQSYISGEPFMKFLEARTREHGHMIGAEFGEGFISRRMLGVNDLFALR